MMKNILPRLGKLSRKDPMGNVAFGGMSFEETSRWGTDVEPQKFKTF